MDSKLSSDMFMEIVSRTSLKTLDTMRCTSKYFEKLTYDSYLLNLHLQRNNIVSGFLVQKQRFNGCDYNNEFAPAPESNTLDLGFLPHNARILASSEQGLIVFESPHPRFFKKACYHVCKPATKQVLEMPNPKTKYLTEKVAMVVIGSKPLHYKIIRLSETKSNTSARYEQRQCTSYRCEIFDSKAWEWRLQDLVKLPYSVFLANEQPITTKGSIYMLLTNKQVLRFEAFSEKWAILSSPVETTEDYKLVKYHGKLGFACMTPKLRCWEIWVLKGDDDEYSWEKLDAFLGERLEAMYDLETRVAWEEMTLVFCRFKGGDYVRKMRMCKGGYYPSRIFPFRSDFEQVDLRG